MLDPIHILRLPCITIYYFNFENNDKSLINNPIRNYCEQSADLY